MSEQKINEQQMSEALDAIPPDPAPATGSIRSYRITPPVAGEYGYGAKAVVRQSGDQFTLREHWGRTEEEARRKAQKELDEWLAEHSGSAPATD